MATREIPCPWCSLGGLHATDCPASPVPDQLEGHDRRMWDTLWAAAFVASVSPGGDPKWAADNCAATADKGLRTYRKHRDNDTPSLLKDPNG